jgi:hypothetical protein
VEALVSCVYEVYCCPNLEQFKATAAVCSRFFVGYAAFLLSQKSAIYLASSNIAAWIPGAPMQTGKVAPSLA